MRLHTRFLLLVASLIGMTGQGMAIAAPNRADVNNRMGGLVVPFEANTGALDPQVAFVARTFAGNVFVTRDGRIVHALAGKGPARQPRSGGWSLVETLDGAAPLNPLGGPGMQGADSPTRINRFIGNDARRWQSHIDTHRSVGLGQAWPGVQVELSAHGNNVEKLFTVAPGARASRIAIRLQGAERLSLDAQGALVVQTGNGDIAFTPPVAWQDIDGRRQPVPVRYSLLDGGRYGFSLGAYDVNRAVVIDPLLQSTYLGGSGNEQAFEAMAVDAGGNVIVVGNTSSTDFPGTAGGAQPAHGADFGGDDVFVAKLNPGLTTLLQASYFGGSGTERVTSVTLDSVGNVVVGGTSFSNDLPGTAGSAQAVPGGSGDGFLAMFNAGLTSLLRATYLGGSGGESLNAVAVDTDGSLVVTGTSNSNNFPGTAGSAQPGRSGNYDVFVARLDSGLTGIVRATYLGGVNYDEAFALLLDAGGNVFVAGYTSSTVFPGTAGGAQPAFAGAYEGFITRLNPGLTSIVQTTFLGGSDYEQILALAWDAGGNVLAAGNTYSTDFPGTAGGAQPAHAADGGDRDAFVAKFNPALTSLLQATYLGGNAEDQAYALVRDGSGDIFVAGITWSSNLPGTSGGTQAAHGGGNTDAFIARLSSDLTTLVKATYLGGSGDESASALVLDGGGNLLLAGATTSTDFPGTLGGAQSAASASNDVYVARLGALLNAAVAPGSAMVTPVPGLSPAALAFLSLLLLGLACLKKGPSRR